MEEELYEYYGVVIEEQRKEETGLSQWTQEKLYPYQRGHAECLGTILQERGLAFDQSPPGVGKSYPALALAYDLGTSPVIVCQKSTLHHWESVCQYMGVKPRAIVNYETLRSCKVYSDSEYRKRRSVDWITVSGTGLERYVWKLPSHSLIIFDEAHVCRNSKTDYGAMLAGAVKSEANVLCLSATLSEREADLAFLLYLTGTINKPAGASAYMRRVIRNGNDPVTHFRQIFSHWCSSMSYSEAMSGLPAQQCSGEVHTVSGTSALRKSYRALVKDTERGVARWTEHRQEIELAKVDLFVRLAEEALETGYSVAIFLNYLRSIELVSERLENCLTITGSTEARNRKKYISRFQKDKCHCMVLQSDTGGTGISLHDVHGHRPRMSLISPPVRASVLIQVLGRIYRAGTKTPVRQRILYCQGVPFEKRLAEKMVARAEHLSQLTGRERDRMSDILCTDADLCAEEEECS